MVNNPKVWVLAFALSFVLALQCVQFVNAQDFTVRLTINNTDSKVYIPGTGERGSSSIGDLTFYTPPHFYLASYINNVLAGLASARGVSIRAYNPPIDPAANHTLEITQTIKDSRIYLAFTEGDYTNIERNIGLIEAGDFLSRVSPSFAYGLGSMFPIKIVLEYPDIDIGSEFTIRKGEYRLAINYLGVSGNKPVIGVRIV